VLGVVGLVAGDMQAVKKKFLTLADADAIWVDEANNVWYWDVEPPVADDDLVNWQILIPMQMGGWNVGPGEPNEEMGPFRKIFDFYRENEVDE
jgi:hypothetical protein